jgi:hypothetical protein
LEEWAVKYGIKINLVKIKAIRFTGAQVKNPLGYSLGDQKNPEANNYKYFYSKTNQMNNFRVY